MNLGLYFLILLHWIACNSCEQNPDYEHGDIRINIITGENWLHNFPLFLGFKIKNPPQFAIWIEDTTGIYLTSVFVTEKIATEGWISNNENRRKESLPHWSHKKGIVYDDGLMLPTKEEPLTDGITGATPKNDKELLLRINDFSTPVVIKAEFNQSTDFNEYFPKTANPDDDNFSGGEGGSGQPAIVYADTLYPFQQSGILRYIGCSSADGTDGELHNEWEKLTTAKKIVEQIHFELIQ